MGARMRVLIVEDEPSIALIEQEALEQDGFEVAVRASGAEAVEVVASWAPDLVILDHGLPDMDGREVLRQIRINSRVPVVVVTARAAEAEIVQSLDLGADDYVVKPFRTPELLARVRAVLRRTGDPPERTAPFALRDLVFDERARRVTKGGEELALTRIEFDIMRMLLRRPGEAVDREEMARTIWNLPLERVGKSLDVHMSVLRRKLGDDPKDPSYIQTVRGIGFRMTAD
jgi:DNA-binding response OmpR family regulator